MARRKAAKPAPGPPQVLPEQALSLVRTQIDKGKALLASRPMAGNAYGSWELVTRNILEKAFGANSPNVSSITDVGKYGSYPRNADEQWWEKRRASSLQTQITRLEGLVELLQTEVELSSGLSPAASPPVTGHGVFLVHGHDDRAVHETARFLEKLQQDVTILREQPNEGRTIIEKFEDYADVGFAVILLTPDDRGGPIEGPHDGQCPRARQNVILELGYFIGRLGRNRVCTLYAEGVEIPSDYSGVLYVPFDEEGAWRLALAKEMKAAGLPIDMNLAL